MAKTAQREVHDLVTTLSEALASVADKKAELDRLAVEVKAASEAHQDAVAKATAIHDQFNAHVGSLIPVDSRAR